MRAQFAVIICTFSILFLGLPNSSLIAKSNGSLSPQDLRVQALEKRVARLESMLERYALENDRLAPAGPLAPMLRASLSVHSESSEGPKFVEGRKAQRSELPQELLPSLGKIGGVATFTTGLNGGAFGLRAGSYLGGSVQLPLALVPGGRLSYEFSAGLMQGSRSLPTTSNVAQVANLAALASLRPNQPATNLTDSAAGTGAAPFAVTQRAKWQAQTVQVIPFALHYSWTRFDRYRLRPYAVIGLGAYVTTSHQTAPAGLRSNANLDAATKQLLASVFRGAPFTGPLIGGQVTSSNELQNSRLPSGQGGTDLGVQSGGGIEWLFPSGLTISVDGRANVIPGGTTYRTLAARWGWRF